MRYTPAQARSLAAVPASPGWFTLAELGKGATASALTRLAMRDDPPVERRMARWVARPDRRLGAATNTV